MGEILLVGSRDFETSLQMEKDWRGVTLHHAYMGRGKNYPCKAARMGYYGHGQSRPKESQPCAFPTKTWGLTFVRVGSLSFSFSIEKAATQNLSAFASGAMLAAMALILIGVPHV